MIRKGPKAITRDVERAACIHTLTIIQRNPIIPSGLVDPMFLGPKKPRRVDFKHLGDALKVMPNLKSLRITGVAVDSASLAEIVNGTAHPFQLELLTCPQSVVLLLGVFLRNQTQITSLSIASFRGSGDWAYPGRMTIPPSSSLLPHSIRRLKGPVDLVMKFFTAKPSHLDYLLFHDTLYKSYKYSEPQKTTLREATTLSTVRSLSVNL